MLGAAASTRIHVYVPRIMLFPAGWALGGGSDVLKLSNLPSRARLWPTAVAGLARDGARRDTMQDRDRLEWDAIDWIQRHAEVYRDLSPLG